MGQKPIGTARGFAQRVTEVIDERRRELGMSKASLISESGMPANTFHTRMRGDRPFDLNDIELLATALGCEPELILREAAEGTAIGRGDAPVTPIRQGVGGSTQTDLETVELDSTRIAASKDNTPIDPSRGES
ncbi:helix-turn-helix transcriptional regulator [Microbacterium sp. BG28]|uniref:helix-turn-helix domain-containing protein n=1 Tax=Microbacterium sp. BG28 TaxID=3097356 RepID=UPI002A5A6AD2|nr:helix-turn-helix transcriptional regulator [Microbacterium sp. BG28]MDY0830767.1 helix-turn-helix transcriptional regulator [Microbacterium sp. BG28]